MPTPRENETQDEWMERCVPIVIDEGKPQEQAVAQCLGMWRDRKEVAMDKATWTQAYQNDLPDSAFLYVESGGSKDEGDKTVPRSKRHLPYKDASGDVDLPHLRNAISRLGQAATGGGKDGWLTEDLRERLLSKAQGILRREQKSLFTRIQDGLTSLVKSLFGDEKGQTEPANADTNRFMVWKDDATERWRWLAIYSNKFRDDDHPPEILSEQAHQEFVQAVRKGEWPMPELWLWHLKGTRFGAADWVAYDDRGFPLAMGLVDEGREDLAQRLAQKTDLGVSHGMLTAEIERDEDDPTIITRYRTAEISVLPKRRAANKLTGFLVKTDTEGSMGLNDEDRKWLEGVLDPDHYAALEAALDEKAQAAEGKEFKEGDQEPEDQDAKDVESADEADTAADEVEDGAEEAAPPPEYATRTEVAEAVGESLRPVYERLDDLAEQMATATKAMVERLGELERDDAEKVAKMVEETPAASLTEMVRSVIGREETRVDGRSKEAKDKPKEAKAPADGPTAVPWLNEMMQGQRRQ